LVVRDYLEYLSKSILQGSSSVAAVPVFTSTPVGLNVGSLQVVLVVVVVVVVVCNYK